MFLGTKCPVATEPDLATGASFCALCTTDNNEINNANTNANTPVVDNANANAPQVVDAAGNGTAGVRT